MAIIPIGEKRMRCQPVGDQGAGGALSKAIAGIVEDDSKPAGDTEVGGHSNSRCIPFAVFLDQ